MKFVDFLKDKIYFILIFVFGYFVLLLMFLAFKVDEALILASSFLIWSLFIAVILLDYFRKRKFYTDLLLNIDRLDKSYLVLETIDKPSFYEGKLLYHALYNINKSMAENVKILELQMNDFKEYIEMWIHEIKIPISSLILMAHNHKEKFDKKALEQMNRILDYAMQVLYYVRSENAEKDYLINEVPLDKVISNIALKNKDDLLSNNIDLCVSGVNFSLYTDSKWLEFILNQIINNSIKYRKTSNSYIKISAHKDDNNIILSILDNGIGIPDSDISRVFDKSFTGRNGRIKGKSTGMGLFIAKKLCTKLGHKIKLESKEGEYTKVIITFSNNDYYKVVK